MRVSLEKLMKKRFQEYRKLHSKSNKSEIQKYVDMVIADSEDLYLYWIDDEEYMHIPVPSWGEVKTIDINIWNTVVERILDSCLEYDQREFLKLSNHYSISSYAVRDKSGFMKSVVE